MNFEWIQVCNNKGVGMSEIEVIRGIARQVLTVNNRAGVTDNWLWDRTQRLLSNVEQIRRLDELTEADMPVDRYCLTVATCFADAGFAHYADCPEASSGLVLADINPADLREFSAKVVSDKLAGLLSEPRIDKISRIIIESANRDTDMTEAKILSDARNLDDMGSVGVFNEFRRCVINGKGVSDALKSWKRKIDYRYWQARLKDSFCFESVRKLAVQRFAAAECFMNQLNIENNAQDLEDIMIESFGEMAEASA
jgi:hypothetical protein